MSRQRERRSDSGADGCGARVGGNTTGHDIRLREPDDARDGALAEGGGRQFVDEQVNAKTYGSVLIALTLFAHRLEQEHAPHGVGMGAAAFCHSVPETV